MEEPSEEKPKSEPKGRRKRPSKKKESGGDEPTKPSDAPIEDGEDSNDPPKPGEDGYKEVWMKPSVVAFDNCQNCHMASPFLHSPAVDQLTNPANPAELLVPVTGTGPYTIIGEEFHQPYTTDLQNSCTSCHRPQCTEHFQNYPLDELVMPPPFQNATEFDHSSISEEDRKAIRDWCNTLDL